ncbi:MAG: DUF4293 domain-containing protein [Marinilabiliaceae bacterium]|nr:DUF4293 domain-containing protein [Marinilabiliaceae bacterium]
MIQRIQTIYILLAVAALTSLFFIDLGHISGEIGLVNITFYSVVDAINGGVLIYLWPLAIMLSITTLLSFLAIFLYRNRLLQMRVSTICATLSIALAIIMLLSNILVANSLDMNWHFHWSLSLPLVSSILLIGAYGKIRKDEELIRSLNRLR